MKVKVVQKEQAEEVPTEIIAQSIKDLSDGMKKLRSGRLNDKALVILIHKSSGVAADTVRRVIHCMTTLEKDYLK